MKRRVWWLMAVAALAGSCSTTTAETTTSTVDVPTPSNPEGSAGGDLTGQLAIIDAQGNVKITDPDGSNPIQMTDDASGDTVYTQPTWSAAEGAIAWGQSSDDGVGVVLANVAARERLLVPTAGPPFYLHFSPTGEYVASLNNGQDGLDFLVVDTNNASVTSFDTGAPYYFSWKPDGTRVAIHEGATRFEVLNPVRGERLAAGETGSGYLAPQWGPGGIFHVTNKTLVSQDIDGDPDSLAIVREFTPFVANSEGTHVALQTTGGQPAISVTFTAAQVMPSDSLVVVNVETGDFEVVSSDITVGFFWSPDGRSLLVFQPLDTGIRLLVWNVDGTSTEFSEFRPSPLLLNDVLPFFPQYAQSLRLWSPDSSAFAYPTEEGIFVQRLDQSEPTNVAEGSWVAWSHG